MGRATLRYHGNRTSGIFERRRNQANVVLLAQNCESSGDRVGLCWLGEVGNRLKRIVS